MHGLAAVLEKEGYLEPLVNDNYVEDWAKDIAIKAKKEKLKRMGFVELFAWTDTEKNWKKIEKEE